MNYLIGATAAVWLVVLVALLVIVFFTDPPQD